MKLSNATSSSSSNPPNNVEQRTQVLAFGLRIIDAFRNLWWVLLILWGIFSYTSNIQYSVTELQAKYSNMEVAVTEIRHGLVDLQSGIAELKTQVGTMQKDVDNSKDRLRDVNLTINDVQKDIKTLLSR